ncbi:MAG TPA: aminotransferase class I/II-fold pyridoxal phosphate-dependent enzyme, partial [Thermoanaerobaculia bacterium]|nr:aminotransferase class I/II-fold pyridoxal phosphate-dependent enzyme [Thermoanaerobaculia bacterium]
MSAPAAGVAPRVAFGDLAEDYRARRAEIDAAIHRVLSRGRFILGDEVRRFEEEFAEAVGAAYAVACGSGTDAVAIALAASGLKPGGEVVLPANTCAPTLAGARMAGARPRLADAEADTLTLDPVAAERAATADTRYFLPVHLYGGVADLDALALAAARKGALLVEDCAQSHGASWKSRPAGTFGRAAAYSFYPSKNLGAYGDGGAVTTNDPEVAAKARALRQYGWTRRDFSESEGWNSRLDEIQAAILRAKRPHLSAWTGARRRNAERYRQRMAALPIVLPEDAPG